MYFFFIKIGVKKVIKRFVVAGKLLSKSFIHRKGWGMFFKIP